MEQEPEPVVVEVAELCPTRLIFLINRFIASVGPLLIPRVARVVRATDGEHVDGWADLVRGTLATVERVSAADPDVRAASLLQRWR